MHARLLAVIFALAGALFAGAVPAVAAAPVVFQVQDVFVDTDPCTGLEHTVTVTATIYDHLEPNVSRATRSITTSSGYIGRGSGSVLFDGAHFILNDMLTNPDTGQRIRVHVVDRPRMRSTRTSAGSRYAAASE